MKILKLLLLVLSLLLFQEGNCAYRILRLNTPYITIDGKRLRSGDTFSSEAKVSWANEKQAMRLMDLETKKNYLITAKMSSGNRSNKIRDMLVSSVQLSSRAVKPSTLTELATQVPDSLTVFVETVLPHNIPTDESHFFYASYRHGEETINKRLGISPDGMVMDKELLKRDGQETGLSEVTIDLFYYDDVRRETVLVKSSIYVSFLPERIEL